MVLNGQITDEQARRLSGDGETTPPGVLPSTSEGDLRRGSYRPSHWPRLATVAVVNDDGTPLMTETERLLARLIELAESIDSRLAAQAAADSLGTLP